MHRRLQQLAGALQGVTPASPRRPLALATRSLTHSSIQCGNARQTLAASPPPTVPRHIITHSLASFSTSTSTSTPISTTLDLPDSSPIPSLAHSSVDHWAQQFFQRHPRPARRDLKYFLDAHLPEMRPENIMFFLYQAARRRVVMPAPLMQQLVTRLQAFPATLPEQQHITAHMIRNGFYGLRCYSIRHPVVGPAQSDTVSASWRIKKIPGEVLQYIQYLTDILLASPMRLSVILHGVQGLGSSEETVRRLLHVVCHKLERSSKNSVFSSRELSTCFYSLRRMRPQDVEVLRLVRVLTAELKLLKQPMSAVELANCFYGLNSMNSYWREVLPLLTLLSNRLYECKEPLNCRQINNILYGMQGMFGKEREVVACIDALSTAVLSSVPHIDKHDMNSQDLALICYGMKNMSSQHPEVRRLVSSLSLLIDKACNVQPFANGNSPTDSRADDKLCFKSGLLDSRAVTTSLLGLKSMSSDYPEVRDLLSTILRKMREAESSSGISPQLQGRWISNGLVGLKLMSTAHAEVLDGVSFLVEQLEQQAGTHSKIVMTEIDAALALSGISAISDDHIQLRRRSVQLLTTQLQRQPPLTFSQSIVNDLDVIVHSCRGLGGLCVDHDETRELLSWLNEKLRRVVTSGHNNIHGGVGASDVIGADTPVLNIDMIRNIAISLSKIDYGEASSLDFPDVRSMWAVLANEFTLLLRDTSCAYPSLSLCYFALCDLASATKCLDLGGDKAHLAFVDRWCGLLAEGFSLSTGGNALNWTLEAVGGMEHAFLILNNNGVERSTEVTFGSTCERDNNDRSIAEGYHHSEMIARNSGYELEFGNMCRDEKGAWRLLEALIVKVGEAGPCFEHPRTNVALRVNTILTALRAFEHVNLHGSERNGNEGTTDSVVARRLLYSIVNNVDSVILEGEVNRSLDSETLSDETAKAIDVDIAVAKQGALHVLERLIDGLGNGDGEESLRSSALALSRRLREV